MNQPHSRVLSVAGTRLLLDGRPFPFQGLSFFNALYNPSFNRSEEDRLQWLHTWQQNGINVLRVWCQWDFGPPHTFVDVDAKHTMYRDSGDVLEAPFARLVALLEAADALGIVIEVTLFSHEKQPNLPFAAQERAVREMTQRLLPFRHVLLQIWNEDSTEIERFYHAAKAVDSDRIVTNSPGFGGDLGDDAQNKMLDVLTPHTSRVQGPFWEIATREIELLLEKYQKPVIDDEPARVGILQFGGIIGGTTPQQHIQQIEMVRACGGYHIYHHDMFQLTYGNSPTSPYGLPDPDYSAFHRQVFDFLRDHRQW